MSDMLEIGARQQCNWLALVTDTGDIDFAEGRLDGAFFRLETLEFVPGHHLLLQLIHCRCRLLVERHTSWDGIFKLVRFNNILNLFAAMSELHGIVRFTAEILRW